MTETTGVRFITPTDEDVEQAPRYVEDRHYSNGEIFFRYNPPREPREEGIVESCVIGVGEPERMKAYSEAKRLNRMVDEWRISKRYGWDAVEEYRKSFPTHLKTGQVGELIQVYLDSPWTKRTLSEDAYEKYTWMLLTAASEGSDTLPVLGDMHIDEVGRTYAEEFHRHIAETRGLHTANHMLSCLRRVFNRAIEWDLTRNNPFARFTLVDVGAGGARMTLWTDEDRDKLMQVASSNERWKDAYKVLLLMRDEGYTLRHALTARDPSGSLLVERKDGRPYAVAHMSKTFARLREAAGLPDNLKIASAFKRSKA